jgi:hypothetical protein
MPAIAINYDRVLSIVGEVSGNGQPRLMRSTDHGVKQADSMIRAERAPPIGHHQGLRDFRPQPVKKHQS